MSIRDLFFKSEPNSTPITAFPRCEHRSPSGRQCSQPICSSSPQFCFTHKPRPEDLLIAELTEAAGSLSTPEEIHRFLTRVTLLRVQGRLTPKEACAYAYLCQILQRGQREIAFHQKLAEDRAQRAAEQAQRDEVDSWSIPRPDRDDEDETPYKRPQWSLPRPDYSNPNDSTQSGSETTTTLVEASSPAQPVASREACLVRAELARPSAPESPSSSTDTLVELSPSASAVSSPSPSSSTDTSVEVFPPRRSSGEGGASASRSHTTNSLVEPSPPAHPVSARSSSKPSGKNRSATAASLTTKNSESSTSLASSTSSTSSTSCPSRDFYNHFYPIDLTLPPGLQDPRKNIPPPDEAECRRLAARRGLLFNRRRPNSRGVFR